MRKNKIYGYNTHYEIYDYDLGDFPELENSLTFYDAPTYTRFPKFYYDKDNRVLYIPRGIDNFLLEEWNGKPITYVDNTSKPYQISFNVTKPPRNETQEKAINYLIGEGPFKSLKGYPQKILIMPTGYGKTYCAISAIQKYHVRTLIIMRTKSLKSQWLDKIKEFTNMGGPNIVEITSSSILERYDKEEPSENNMIFIVTRQLLMSYMKKHGMKALNTLLVDKMRIGLKIFDEVHQEYYATFLLDYATNIKYTFYLTATFSLSDYKDDKIFQSAYNTINKLRIKQDDDARHIVYIAILFNSKPNAVEDHRITGKKRGFDRFAYIDYELEKGVLENEVRDVIRLFLKEKKLKGKLLLLSSKQTTCDYFNNVIKSEMNDEISSCAIYTDNKVDNYKEYDAISATPGMLGTGEDIPGLRFLINTEPISSLTNTDQFSGRLRPYEGGTKPTYYIEFVDMGFPVLYSWYHKRKKLLSKKVKECFELRH